jgi:hypothetical protein
MPLQTGVSAVWSATRAVLFLLAAPFFTALPALAGGPEAPLTIALLPLGIGLFAYGGINAHRAARQRTSDIVLSPEGILVEGGPHHGTRIAWEELYAQGVYTEEREEKRTTFFGIILTSLLFWLLVVLAVLFKDGDVLKGFSFVRLKVKVTKLGLTRSHEGRSVVTWIAETDEGIEAISLQAAARSIAAVVQGHGDAPPNGPAVQAAIVTCHGCGAPVPPTEAPSVTCEYCETVIALPPEVRTQAAAHRTLAARHAEVAPMLDALFRQEAPEKRNARLLWVALAMAASWVAGWALVLVRVPVDRLTAMDSALLGLPLLAALALAFHLRAPLAERQAMQLLTLRFGALAPARPGERPRCRRCHGALPVVEGTGLCTCLYCGADNVLGVDLRPAVDAARAEEASLVETVERSKSERARWRVLAIVGDVLAVAWIAASIAAVFVT